MPAPCTFKEGGYGLLYARIEPPFEGFCVLIFFALSASVHRESMIRPFDVTAF